MFKFLTSKKGFTLVELLIVLVLLGLGVFAVGNIVRVSYRAFDKSEERFVKQEAVKTAAELLRTGSNSVAAAMSADVFPSGDAVGAKTTPEGIYSNATVVPAGESVDEAYSYLFTEPSYDEETGEMNGYYLYIQNKGQKRANAILVSDVPMYVEIDAYIDYSYDGAAEKENQGAVDIMLAALESDYAYEDNDGDGKIDPPTSDDIYYSLKVTYHFPNIVTNDTGIMVNYIKKEVRSEANLYNQSNGNMLSSNGEYVTVQSIDTDGSVLRVYCDSILSGDNTNTSIAVPKLCFVATASYGYDSGEVGLLCQFRDECLLTNPLGTAFVKAYYTISPPIADFIAQHEGLRAAVRLALKPLIVVAEYAVNDEIAPVGAAWFAVFMLCGLSTSVILVRVDKRRKREAKSE